MRAVNAPTALQNAKRMAQLRQYHATWHVLPSYSHMCGMFRMRSKSSVACFVARLHAEGLVTVAPDGALAPTRKFLSLDCSPSRPAERPAGTASAMASVRPSLR